MSTRTKKPRPDAKLLNLPEDQAAALSEWLLSGMSYGRARALMKKQFGISASLSSFSGFWEAICAPELLRRRARTVKMADEFADLVKKEPGSWDAVLLDQVKQKAFEMANNPGFKATDLAALMQLVLKAQEQKLRAEALEHEKEKFRAALRTKVEAGLDALYQEIKSNPKAVARFKDLQEAMAS